jgi:hypothetical protein
LWKSITNPNGNRDCHRNGDSHRDCNCNPHSDCYTDGDRDGHSDRNRNGHAKSYSHSKTHANPEIPSLTKAAPDPAAASVTGKPNEL